MSLGHITTSYMIQIPSGHSQSLCILHDFKLYCNVCILGNNEIEGKGVRALESQCWLELDRFLETKEVKHFNKVIMNHPLSLNSFTAFSCATLVSHLYLYVYIYIYYSYMYVFIYVCVYTHIFVLQYPQLEN